MPRVLGTHHQRRILPSQRVFRNFNWPFRSSLFHRECFVCKTCSANLYGKAVIPKGVILIVFKHSEPDGGLVCTSCGLVKEPLVVQAIDHRPRSEGFFDNTLNDFRTSWFRIVPQTRQPEKPFSVNKTCPSCLKQSPGFAKYFLQFHFTITSVFVGIAVCTFGTPNNKAVQY